MTPDDRTLVQFLRQHRPTVPPAAVNLEDQIMAALSATDWETDREMDLSPHGERSSVPMPPGRRSRRWGQGGQRWLVAGTALVASLFAAWVGQRVWVTAQAPSPEEVAELEQFMEQSWQGAVVSTSTDSDTAFWLEAGFE